MAKRALIVDDEPVLALTLATFLEMDGFVAETAASASEGMSKLAQQKYDLVLTDLKMESELAGYDVAKAAKEQAHRPIVIIMTALPNVGQKCADALIQKPFRLDLILDLFTQKCGERSGAPPSGQP